VACSHKERRPVDADLAHHLELAKSVIGTAKIAATIFPCYARENSLLSQKEFPVMAFQIPCYLQPSPTVETF
jgi:hypothetical protein